MKKNFKKFIVAALLLGLLCGCNQVDHKQNNNDVSVNDNSQDKNDNQENNGQAGTNQGENKQEEDRKPQDVVFLETPDYTVEDPDNERGLSTKRFPFGCGAAKNGQADISTVEDQKKFDAFDLNALAWDNKTQDKKVLYLTFDCGYKWEDLTDRILDTLKEKNVKSAFFCTMHFLKQDPEGVQRMLDEGHIVGNHSTTHPDCTTITRTEFGKELQQVDEYMRENYGVSTKYFRFPTGAYSENALDLANGQGYRSIFWSIAHRDWDPENQPGVDVSFATVTQRLHPGAVILLHSTSPDNVAILGDFIDYARNAGYEFCTLDEYAYWK